MFELNTFLVQGSVSLLWSKRLQNSSPSKTPVGDLSFQTPDGWSWFARVFWPGASRVPSAPGVTVPSSSSSSSSSFDSSFDPLPAPVSQATSYVAAAKRASAPPVVVSAAAPAQLSRRWERATGPGVSAS